MGYYKESQMYAHGLPSWSTVFVFLTHHLLDISKSYWNLIQFNPIHIEMDFFCV